MALSDEEIKELKQQLKDQVHNLPPDKKKEAEAHIDSMTPQALEAMLEQQKSKQQVYRMIVNKELEAVVVKETPKILAVLDIRPLSKSHTVVIPKNQITKKSDLPEDVQKAADEVSDSIKLHFNPKTVHKRIEEKFGEVIIELIPEYDFPIDFNANRKPVTLDSLEPIAKELQKEIIKKEVKPVQIQAPKESKTQAEPVKLKRRIP